MKIQRGILDIELTWQEMDEAYREQQRLYDIEDIISIRDFYENDEQFKEEFGITPDELKAIADKVAYRYRKFREDDSWYEDAVEAIRLVAHDRKEN